MHRPPLVVLCCCALLAQHCSRSPLDPQVPELKLSPTFLRFTARPNEVVTPIQVSVVGATAEAYAFRAVIDAPWIVVTPKTGTTPAVVSVSVITTGVPLGTNLGSIHFEMLSQTAGATGASLTVELELSSPGWSSLEGPYGSSAVSLAVDPDDPSVVLAGTRRGAVLRSTDGGATFSRLAPFLGDSNEIWSIAMAPGGRGYLGTDDDGVWRTDDHGSSWQPTGLQNTRVNAVLFDPGNPNRVLAEGTLAYFSTDGGTTFQTTPSPDPWFIHLDPTGVSTFILGGDDGQVYRGDGASFTPFTQFEDKPAVDFVVTATGRWVYSSRGIGSSTTLSTVVLSDDRGVTWQEVPAGLPYTESPFRLWVVGGTIYVGNDSGLYQSTDDGELFNTVTPPTGLASAFGPRVGDILPVADGLLVTFWGDGVFHLAADGTWRQSHQVDLSTTQLEYQTATGGLVLITDNNTLHRYLPGSGFAGIAGTGLDFWSLEHLTSLSVDPRNPAVIWVSGYCRGLWRSLDGGQTWAGANNGSHACVWGLTRSSTNPDVFWTGTDGGIFRSTDNGLNFQLITTRNAGGAAIVNDDLAVFESAGNLLRVDSAGSVTTVHDGSEGCRVWWVKRTEDGTLWSYGSCPGLLRSDDGGLTFTPLGLANGDVSDLAIDPGSPSHVFIATDYGVGESRDRGTTFADSGCPFPAWSLALDATGRRLFVGTELGGVYVFAFTP